VRRLVVGCALAAAFAALAGSASGAALARLSAVATVVEYEVDADGNYRWQLWEWK